MTNAFLRSLDARWPALRSQAGNTVYVALHSFADITTSFLLVILLARLLPPEGLGQYNYLYALAGLASVVLMLGMKTVIQRAAAKGEESFLMTGTRYQAKFVPLFWAVFVVAVYLLRRDLFTPTILFVALAASLFYLADNYIYYLFGQQRFRGGAWRKVIVDASVLVAVIGVVALSASPTLAVLTYFLVAMFVHGIFFWQVLRSTKRQAVKGKASLRLGKQLSLLSVLGITRLYFDRIIVGSFLGLTPLAFYSLAYAYGDLLTAAGKVVAAVIFPVSARQSDREVASTMRRYSLPLLGGFVLLTPVLMIAASPLFNLLFPRTYSSAIVYAQILPLVILPKALGTVLTRILEARGQVGPIYRVNFVAYALELLLIAVLTPLFGLPGLIVGEAIAYLLFFVLAVLFVMVIPFKRVRKSV